MRTMTMTSWKTGQTKMMLLPMTEENRKCLHLFGWKSSSHPKGGTLAMTT